MPSIKLNNANADALLAAINKAGLINYSLDHTLNVRTVHACITGGNAIPNTVLDPVIAVLRSAGSDWCVTGPCTCYGYDN